MHQLSPYLEAAGRILLAAIFLFSGFGKISSFEATQAYMAAAGVPGGLLPLVIAFELVGGLAIVVGWWTRLAALLLAGFSLVTAVLFHGEPGDPIQSILFLKNLAIAGGFLLLVVHGAGALSVDGRAAARAAGVRA